MLRIRLPLLTVLLLGASAPLAAQDLFWVDAGSGVDSPARDGSETEPFRTLTYALGRQSAGRSLEVVLRRGLYFDESWPVFVGPDPLTIRGDEAGAPYVFGFGTSFENFVLDSAAGDFTLKGLTLVGAQNVVMVERDAAAVESLEVVLDRVSVLGGLLVNARVQDDAELFVDVRRSWFRGADTGLKLAAYDDGQIRAEVRRSRIFRPTFGIFARSYGSATVDVFVENSIISQCLRQAVYLQSAGGPAHVELLHCNLARNGAGWMPPLAAIKILTPSPGASVPTMDIRRSILWSNGKDIAGYPQVAANLSFETNLVEDAALIGVGGNFAGPPDWLAGPFALLPGSSAIGAGSPGTAVDFHGRPRGGTASDLGAMEHQRYTLNLDAGTWVGHGQEFVVTGDPNTAYAVYAGFERSAGPGLGVRPFVAGNPLLRGRLDATGVAERLVLWPVADEFRGRRFFLQVVGKDAAGVLHFSEVVAVNLTRVPHAS